MIGTMSGQPQGITWRPVERFQYGFLRPTVYRMDKQDEHYGGGAHEYTFNKMFKNEETGQMDFTDSTTPVLKFVETTNKGVTLEGVTDEQLLICMIDRQKRLNSRFPSREGSIVVTKLEEALFWKEERAREREARGVLTKMEK